MRVSAAIHATEQHTCTGNAQTLLDVIFHSFRLKDDEGRDECPLLRLNAFQLVMFR